MAWKFCTQVGHIQIRWSPISLIIEGLEVAP